MPRIRRQLYAWHDPRRGYLVSRYPADAPVRPSIAFETPAEVMAMAQRRHAEIHWWPPLTERECRSMKTPA